MVQLGELGPCCLDCGAAPHPGEPCTPQPPPQPAASEADLREALLHYEGYRMRQGDEDSAEGIAAVAERRVDAYLAARAAYRSVLAAHAAAGGGAPPKDVLQ